MARYCHFLSLLVLTSHCGTECATFIDTLFTVLRTKSYMPYTSSSAPYPPSDDQNMDTGIPIPLDALLSPSSPQRGLKRSNESDGRNERPSPKGPRLNSDGQFSRYGNERGASSGGWGHRDGRGGRPGANGHSRMNDRHPQTYQPPEQKRGTCRDYYSMRFSFFCFPK
jgi:RNA-binding protein 26